QQRRQSAWCHSRSRAAAVVCSCVADLAAEAAQVDAQGCGGGIQALIVGKVEENLRLRRAAQPDVIHQLCVQLAGLPARVAEGNEVALRVQAIGDGEQHVLGCGHAQ